MTVGLTPARRGAPMFATHGPEAYITVLSGKAEHIENPAQFMSGVAPYNHKEVTGPWVTVVVYEPYSDKSPLEKLLLKVKGRERANDVWPLFVVSSAASDPGSNKRSTAQP